MLVNTLQEHCGLYGSLYVKYFSQKKKKSERKTTSSRKDSVLILVVAIGMNIVFCMVFGTWGLFELNFMVVEKQKRNYNVETIKLLD